MKIEISEAFPEYFRPSYPEEFELFSHFETTAGIPSSLFAITTWKENGLPNICFHAWSCFHGDRTAFFAVMGNLYQHTHTYANILREKCFALNFLPIACYDRLVETIRRNGMDEDEFEAGGFALEEARTIHAPLIAEAFLSLECTLTEAKDPTGATAKTASCCWCPRRRTCSPARRGSRALRRWTSNGWTKARASGASCLRR